MMRVSIVVLTKNESQSLEGLLQKLVKTTYEIIVVDGHSTDTTRDIAQKYAHKVVLDNKRGKGDAIRTSLSHVSGEIVVFIDADGSHDPMHIEKLVAPIRDRKADMVIASRMLGGSEEFFGNPTDYFRFLTNKVANILINTWFRSRITDSQNGFRAIKKEIILDLDLVGNGFSIEQEMTMKMLKKGHRINEVASLEKKRQHGNSHLTMKVWPELVFGFFRWFI